ncbi:hypothetical protein NQ117_03265 [Paenibacillus sp. SC116]|nr:hypothetical protein [Paenibacillus sp. SC116]
MAVQSVICIAIFYIAAIVAGSAQMKKMLLIPLSIFVFILTACSNGINSGDSTSDLAEMSITTVTPLINPTTKSRLIQSTEQPNHAELFQSLMKDTSKTIPYVQLGDKIEIELKEQAMIHLNNVHGSI